MLNQKEVLHISKLARLGLAGKELKKYEKDLSSILDYIEKLKKVNIADTIATSHPFAVKNVMRADEAEKKNRDLAALAPETKDDYVKVKSILK